MKLDKRPSDPRELREIANSPEVQHEARGLAKDIQRDARRIARAFRNTGNLERHIEVEEITDLTTGIEGFAVGWGDAAWYGWIVENGTEHSRARPHLVPAAIRNGAKGVRR